MEYIITKCDINTSETRSKLENNVTNEKHIWKYGCKIKSQNGEDGIIFHILNAIGTTNKTTVEICAGDGIECNSANLILNHDFHGILFDGNVNALKNGLKFYNSKNLIEKVSMCNCWLTAENVVEALHLVKTPIEPDLLITDVDGIDYWLVKAIVEGGFKPRVICVEYQDIIGPYKSITVPYDPNFNHQLYDCYEGPNYCGASLKAFINLLAKYNYAFVGCEGLGFNGFFVRKDVLEKQTILTEMTDISPCFNIPKVKFGMEKRFPRTCNMKWIEV